MTEKKKSNLSRAFSEDGAIKTHVGGQALIEGVMMRGKYNWAAAIRTPEGGVYTEQHDLASGKKKNKWMTLPLIRGCVALVESLGLGFKALDVATRHAFDKFDMSYDAYVQAGIDPKTATEIERARAAGCTIREMTEEEIAAKKAEVAAAKNAEQAAAEEAAKPESAKEAAAKNAEVAVAQEAEAAEGAAEPPATKSAAAVSSSSETPAPTSAQTPSATASSATKNAEAATTSEATPAPEPQNSLTGGLMTVSMVIGVIMGIALFIVAPAALTNWIVGEYDTKTVLWNVVDGVIRVLIFVFYLWAIGRMKDIKRMFSYHGAEHKTIHCYEHGLDLTPENAAQFPRLHIRCGTAFLIMVMILAILVYTIIPVNALIEAWGVPDGLPKFLLVVAVRILFMPVIAGLAYEINVKWAGQHPNNPLVRVILWPGLQMQYLTTNEPDASMLECAIASMKIVLEREQQHALGAK